MAVSSAQRAVLPLFTLKDAAAVALAVAVGSYLLPTFLFPGPVTYPDHIFGQWQMEAAKKAGTYRTVFAQDVAPYLPKLCGLVCGALALAACVIRRGWHMRRDQLAHVDGLTARIEDRWQRTRADEERRRVEQAASYERRNADILRQHQQEVAARQAKVHQLEMNVIRAFPRFLAEYDIDGSNSKEANERAFRLALISGSFKYPDLGLLREATDAEVLRLIGDKSKLPPPSTRLTPPVLHQVPAELQAYL